MISAANLNLIDGIATVAVTLNTPGTLALSAASGGLIGASDNINIAPADSAFAVSAPAQAMADSPFRVTVQALDQYGNIVTGYTGPVSITSSDDQAVAVVGGDAMLTNGIGSFQVAIDTANTVTLTAGVGEVEGTTGPSQVGPAAASSFEISAPPTAAAGIPFTVTLTAKDASGMTATGYSGQVTIASSDNQTVTAASVTCTMAWAPRRLHYRTRTP